MRWILFKIAKLLITNTQQKSKKETKQKSTFLNERATNTQSIIIKIKHTHAHIQTTGPAHLPIYQPIHPELWRVCCRWPQNIAPSLPQPERAAAGVCRLIITRKCRCWCRWWWRLSARARECECRSWPPGPDTEIGTCANYWSWWRCCYVCTCVWAARWISGSVTANGCFCSLLSVCERERERFRRSMLGWFVIHTNRDGESHLPREINLNTRHNVSLPGTLKYCFVAEYFSLLFHFFKLTTSVESGFPKVVSRAGRWKWLYVEEDDKEIAKMVQSSQLVVNDEDVLIEENVEPFSKPCTMKCSNKR